MSFNKEMYLGGLLLTTGSIVSFCGISFAPEGLSDTRFGSGQTVSLVTGLIGLVAMLSAAPKGTQDDIVAAQRI